MRLTTPLLPLLGTLSLVSGFYLPGVAPTDYNADDIVPLNVNRLTPTQSQSDQQLRSLISYDYYHTAFQFCRPSPGPKKISESLGSILFGDRIMTSPFELHMAKNETCKAVPKCELRKYDQRKAKFVNRRISQNYNINWLIDGLPAATLNFDEILNSEFYSQGFPLGSIDPKSQKPMFNNHYDILVDYHELAGRTKNQFRVVGVVVQPSSRKSKLDANAANGADCSDTSPLILSEDSETEVLFTYSVYWRPSPTAWATRWDKYLHVFDPRIHWFSLVNSAIIVIFLTGMVAMVLLRALRKDIAQYNQLDLNEGVQEDSGWKLVHGDVFRPPRNPLLLSVFLGSGAQLFFMTGATIAFALLGFLSPSNRGSLGTVMILLYTLFGFIGGYVSARAYKSFGGESWKKNIIFTPIFIPGIVFGSFFLLNFFLIFEQSSGAVPLTTMLALVGIWFVISLPLSFFGSWVGFKQPTLEAPVRTNQIPRQIPEQAVYLKQLPSMMLVGILPFGAIFVELYFIMNSIWFQKVYYMFGFLFVCYGIMIITCSTVTILMIYFLLRSENYHWQWRAFFTAGASAIYIFLNALLYWVSKLSLGGFTSNVLYLGYSALIGFLFFVLTGTIGFFSSWLFVRKIYASIKIE
ncbi:Transmembrane 9 superfamily member 2 [Rhizina undulata]